VRVITGEARGRRLRPVPGEDTRPTSARVKESIFNIIQFDIEGRRVLDLFAGTGQLGIEAISRGAKVAVFLDNNPEALAVIRDNLGRTGLLGRAEVVPGDARAYLRRRPDPFDIIFMDPPYHDTLLAETLTLVASAGLLREGGLVVCECAAGTALSPPTPSWQGRMYRYGTQTVFLFRRDP